MDRHQSRRLRVLHRAFWVLAAVMLCAASSETRRCRAQAPDWLLPIGAKIRVAESAPVKPETLSNAPFELAETKSATFSPPPAKPAAVTITGTPVYATPFQRDRFSREIEFELSKLPAFAKPSPLRLPPTQHGPDEAFEPQQTLKPTIDPATPSHFPTETLLPTDDALIARPAPTLQSLPLRSTRTDTDKQSQPNEHFTGAPFQSPLETSGIGNIYSTAALQGVEGVPTDSAPIWTNDFSPTPLGFENRTDAATTEQWVYDAKRDVPTQSPWIEWGRRFYGDGITPRGRNWFGAKNLARPQFYMYGDVRSGIAAGRNAQGRTDNWANRLNLDMDLQVTDTERFHAFVGPLDRGAQTTRYERVGDDFRFRNEFDLTPVTGFFEGDLGVMLGAAHGTSPPFDLPVAIGLVPLLMQNGIWIEDAVTGAAVSLPARHSRLLNWSNYDLTFFTIFDQLNSPAFGRNEHAAQAFGSAIFIEAYDGYIEAGYAYLRDRNFDPRSYHNLTASYTRRYFDRISNSLRIIVNAGQDLPQASRTADGVLLLVENSWITAAPLTVVPYANFFVGWDRPQSVARAGVSGGILRNTGINFDTDGLNGFATLDPTGHDTAGGSIGIDLLGRQLDRQLILEASYLTPHGSANPAVLGDQYAIGTRCQLPVSHCTLWRADLMHGWRNGQPNVYGTRLEYRWKF